VTYQCSSWHGAKWAFKNIIYIVTGSKIIKTSVFGKTKEWLRKSKKCKFFVFIINKLEINKNSHVFEVPHHIINSDEVSKSLKKYRQYSTHSHQLQLLLQQCTLDK
jgi:hypothetical protein